MGRFEIYQGDKDELWHWQYYAVNDEPVATSCRGFKLQDDCIRNIQIMKQCNLSVIKIIE